MASATSGPAPPTATDVADLPAWLAVPSLVAKPKSAPADEVYAARERQLQAHNPVVAHHARHPNGVPRGRPASRQPAQPLTTAQRARRATRRPSVSSMQLLRAAVSAGPAADAVIDSVFHLDSQFRFDCMTGKHTLHPGYDAASASGSGGDGAGEELLYPGSSNFLAVPRRKASVEPDVAPPGVYPLPAGPPPAVDEHASMLQRFRVGDFSFLDELDPAQALPEALVLTSAADRHPEGARRWVDGLVQKKRQAARNLHQTRQQARKRERQWERERERSAAAGSGVGAGRGRAYGIHADMHASAAARPRSNAHRYTSFLERERRWLRERDPHARFEDELGIGEGSAEAGDSGRGDAKRRPPSAPLPARMRQSRWAARLRYDEEARSHRVGIVSATWKRNAQRQAQLHRRSTVMRRDYEQQLRDAASAAGDDGSGVGAGGAGGGGARGGAGGGGSASVRQLRRGPLPVAPHHDQSKYRPGACSDAEGGSAGGAGAEASGGGVGAAGPARRTGDATGDAGDSGGVSGCTEGGGRLTRGGSLVFTLLGGGPGSASADDDGEAGGGGMRALHPKHRLTVEQEVLLRQLRIAPRMRDVRAFVADASAPGGFLAQYNRLRDVTPPGDAGGGEGAPVPAAVGAVPAPVPADAPVPAPGARASPVDWLELPEEGYMDRALANDTAEMRRVGGRGSPRAGRARSRRAHYADVLAAAAAHADGDHFGDGCVGDAMLAQQQLQARRRQQKSELLSLAEGRKPPPVPAGFGQLRGAAWRRRAAQLGGGGSGNFGQEEKEAEED